MYGSSPCYKYNRNVFWKAASKIISEMIIFELSF